MTDRPRYTAALAALQSAHDACYKHPERGVLGMSHGPFSGVNVALGIVARLEIENALLRKRVQQLVTNDRPDPDLDRTLSAVNDALNKEKQDERQKSTHDGVGKNR